MGDAAAPPVLSEARKSRLRLGVLVDRDVRNYSFFPIPVDYPDEVEIRGTRTVEEMGSAGKNVRGRKFDLTGRCACPLALVAGSLPAPIPSPVTEAEKTAARAISDALLHFLTVAFRFAIRMTDGPAPGTGAAGPTALHAGPGSLDLVGRPGVLPSVLDARRAHVRLESAGEFLGYDPWSSVAKAGHLCAIDVKARAP